VLEARDLQPPVPGAGCQHNGARTQLLAVCESQHVATIGKAERIGLSGDGEVRAEPAGLDHSPVGELSARDARGKAEVVLDP
jgi:hypothetical protein